MIDADEATKSIIKVEKFILLIMLIYMIRFTDHPKVVLKCVQLFLLYFLFKQEWRLNIVLCSVCNSLAGHDLL